MNFMKTIYPPKIGPGAHLRVIAPARSLGLISPENIGVAKTLFDQLGLKISFGKHVHEKDEFNSSSVRSRITDLHEAFADKSVNGILSVIGGYNSGQLLGHIDSRLIADNPKILCGFSDITTLSNAIYAKTGLVGYSGPHFSSFGMKKGFEYTLDSFKRCLFGVEPYTLVPSKEWSDDSWFSDQETRTFTRNEGYRVVNKVEGTFEGTIVGGHLGSFALLQGTSYWLSLKDAIVMVEETETTKPEVWDQRLQSLLHQKDADQIKAILIGRVPPKAGMSIDMLSRIIKSKDLLGKVPVIANLNFGHTTPIVTYPIGGQGKINISGDNAEISIVKH